MEHKACILVIDDRERTVRVVQRLLEKEGYEVLTALDGVSGLVKARGEKPDLIILDIMMPGMNGYEVCRRLQRNQVTARIPVLMLTGKGQIDVPNIDDETIDICIQERMEGFESGALEFLSKPVTAKGLLDRVRALLWFGSLPT